MFEDNSHISCDHVNVCHLDMPRIPTLFVPIKSITRYLGSAKKNKYDGGGLYIQRGQTCTFDLLHEKDVSEIIDLK